MRGEQVCGDVSLDSLSGERGTDAPLQDGRREEQALTSIPGAGSAPDPPARIDRLRNFLVVAEQLIDTRSGSSM